MTPDVLTNLYGGLGNQLFQYAATLHAMPIVGATSYELLVLEGHDDGLTIGDFLPVRMRYPTRSDRARWTEFARLGGPLSPVLTRTSALYERTTTRRLIKQTSPFDDVVPLAKGRAIKLEGFFQNPGWYLDSWSTVADSLVHHAPLGYEGLVAEQRTVLHVRRGDYIRAGWDMAPRYYLDAIAGLDIAGRDVVIVSDEPSFVPWLGEVIASVGCRVLPPVPLTGVPAMDDFWNIAAGGCIVMANSTYSWWAASIATARSGDVQVGYPSPWIVNRWSAGALPDLRLPGWTTFDSGLPESV